MAWSRTTFPTVEPVSLEDAMLHLRLDGYGESPAHPDEPLIESLIIAAREWAEAYTDRIFADCEIEVKMAALPYLYAFPFAPVRSVASITYLDEDNVRQTLDPTLYGFDPGTEEPVLYKIPGATYPTAQAVPGSVVITCQAGYSEDESPVSEPIPETVKRAMLLYVGHLYENREDSTPGAIPVSSIPRGMEYLLHRFRRHIL